MHTIGLGSRLALACVAAGLLLAGCRADPPTGTVPVHQPAVLARLPHDTNAFTQGLLLDGNHWLESTGLQGQSSLREVEQASGRILRTVSLPRIFFGEGLALFQDRLYQLTWQNGVCLVYDRSSLRKTKVFRYEGEGWGLTCDEDWLYMSDGSATIQVRHPDDFSLVRTFEVRTPQGPIPALNELEWIDGKIWANIYPTKQIVRFSPASGQVRGFVDLSHLPLAQDQHPQQDVLNGIAYDHATGSIWVTGKNWKALYRIAWPPQP